MSRIIGIQQQYIDHFLPFFFLINGGIWSTCSYSLFFFFSSSFFLTSSGFISLFISSLSTGVAGFSFRGWSVGGNALFFSYAVSGMKGPTIYFFLATGTGRVESIVHLFLLFFFLAATTALSSCLWKNQAGDDDTIISMDILW